MKKRDILSLAAIMLLSLTGCGDGGKKVITDEDGNVVLSYYVWGNNNEVGLIQDIIDAFEEENEGIKVKIERAGDDYYGDLKLKFASRNAPDIFLMNPGEIRPFLDYEYIEPLDSYLAESETLTTNDLWEINDGYRFDGKSFGQGSLYALIKDWSPDFMLMYNKNQVEDYRKAHPGAFPYLEEDEPMTWSEFYEFSTSMTIGSGSGISRYGTTMDNEPYKHLMEWIQMYGSSMFKDNDTKFNGNDASVKKAIEFFLKLQEDTNGVAAPSPWKGSTALAVGGERFKNGTVSSVFLGRWGFSAYDWANASFDIGVTYAPVPDEYNVVDENGKRVPYQCVSGMIANCINADSPSKDEAFKFIEYYQTEGMKLLVNEGYNIPGNKTYALNQFANTTDPEMKAVNDIFLKAAEYSHPIQYNSYVSTTTIENRIKNTMGLYFERKEGITTVDALIAKIEELINNEISKNL